MTAKHDADAAHRAGLHDALAKAAGRLSVCLAGDAVYGWRDRSVGSPVGSAQGRLWLRVVRELAEWTDGQFWTGNADGSVLPVQVQRPAVVAADEWDDGPVRCRAELMTFVGASRCSPTPELRARASLDAAWSSLRGSLGALAEVATPRVAATTVEISRNLAVFFGLDLDLSFTMWSTAHGDLQWTNLTQPECWLLDWEAWGAAPAGLDAATLYCHTPLVSDAAREVHNAFADVLETPTGRVAQLHAISRMLWRIHEGDYPDLAIPLHRHARRVIAGLDPDQRR